MAMHLGALPWEMTVLDPPELRDIMREQAARMLRAARGAGAREAGDTRPRVSERTHASRGPAYVLSRCCAGRRRCR